MKIRELGEFFGYPDCCIKWFIEHRHDPFPNCTPLTPKQYEVAGYRGFIPCPVCAEKVTFDSLHTLIQNRKCTHSFPTKD